jgi:hypothetical protein
MTLADLYDGLVAGTDGRLGWRGVGEGYEAVDGGGLNNKGCQGCEAEMAYFPSAKSAKSAANTPSSPIAAIGG